MKVDLVTNIAPHYREHLWLELVQLENCTFRFVFGEEPTSSIRQIDFGANHWRAYQDNLTRVRNVRFRHALVWQRGVLGRLATTDAEVAVILGDMHVLSNWFAALLLRLRRRKVVFWGHGLSGGDSRSRLLFRLLFLRLAHMNLVYGKRAKRLLADRGFPDRRISVIFNSLDYEKQKSLRQSSIDPAYYREAGWFQNADLPVLVFLGRLTRQKNLQSLIEVVTAPDSGRPTCNLIFVGDGPERQRLEALAASASGNIHFFGACYEDETLAKLIANADLCVSPGEIGLAAIHALSFGTPACTHDDLRKQGPEVEAIVEGKTGTFFDGTAEGLRACVERWLAQNHDREKIRSACYRVIDENYNPAVQVKVLQNAFARLGFDVSDGKVHVP